MDDYLVKPKENYLVFISYQCFAPSCYGYVSLKYAKGLVDSIGECACVFNKHGKVVYSL